MPQGRIWHLPNSSSHDLSPCQCCQTQNIRRLIITIGSDLEGSKGAVELSERFDFIYATIGIHPHDAKDFTDDTLDQLKSWVKNSNPPLPPFTKGGRGGITNSQLRNPKIVAIGEIGLGCHC